MVIVTKFNDLCIYLYTYVRCRPVKSVFIGASVYVALVATYASLGGR